MFEKENARFRIHQIFQDFYKILEWCEFILPYDVNYELIIMLLSVMH